MSNDGTKHHTLYRMYDGDGALLYVGQTTNFAQRLSAHRHEKAWWLDIVTIRLGHFDTLAAVRQAEQDAIRDEHPRYNITHTEMARETAKARQASRRALVDLWQDPPEAEDLRAILEPTSRLRAASEAAQLTQALVGEYGRIVGEAVVEMRQTMSYGQIATALGVSRGRVQQIEQRHLDPDGYKERRQRQRRRE